MSIYNQFKQKKKRLLVTRPPPRPNLLSHEKQMKESKIEFVDLQRKVEEQAAEIESLRVKYNRLSSSMEMLIGYVRKSK